MTDVVFGQSFLDKVEPELFRATRTAAKRLQEDSTRAGLHVETIASCRDGRVRTARVNQQYRMVLFDLGSRFLLHGVYDHDEAYRVAERTYLRVNDVSKALEIRDVTGESDDSDGSTAISEEEIESRARARAAEIVAEQQALDQQQQAEERVAEPVLHVSVEDLTGILGIDAPIAEAAVEADEDALNKLVKRVPSWQRDALMDLATGGDLHEVRTRYVKAVPDDGAGRTVRGSAADTPSEDEDVRRSLEAELADDSTTASFHLLRPDDDLAKILETRDFGRWTIFLHLEQREYVEKQTGGPYRLDGGAGTGKTVVLVHRAVRLARRPASKTSARRVGDADGLREVLSTPQGTLDGIGSGGQGSFEEVASAPRVVLTTFTRNLAGALDDQVTALDPTVPRAKALARPGLLVKGVDQLAHEVLAKASNIEDGLQAVLGWSTARDPGRRRGTQQGWRQAVNVAGVSLEPRLQSDKFLDSEYLEVVLPQRITTEQEYLRASRAGRGTKLGRKQRKAVWAVIAQYREDGMHSEQIDYAETAAVAAAVLDRTAERTGGDRPADHVLIDEGQDLNPVQWQLLRALVGSGKDDMFIAEDAHQRIYGNRIVLKRYGINIQGRSRRLRLNYRTTAQNLHFALSVLEGGDYSLSEAEAGDFDEVEEQGEYRSVRSGPAPQFIGASNVLDEYEHVALLVAAWQEELEDEGLSPENLGLLTRSRSDRDRLVKALDERRISVESVDRNAPSGNVPRVMTLHRSKGMEFARVILFGVGADAVPAKLRGFGYDDNHEAENDAELRERSLLYVGASRGRDRLAVTWSRETSTFAEYRRLFCEWQT